MPVHANFSYAKYADGVLTVGLQQPAPIGNWTIQFTTTKHFGTPNVSGLISKIAGSGTGGGQSGITIVDSGQGRFNVKINSVDTSGLDYGNYAGVIERVDSGFRTILSEGFLTVTP